MRNFLIIAAAAAAVAAFAPGPAGAIENHGPIRVGDQCFKSAVGLARDARFGIWVPCPQPASAKTSKRRKK